MWGEGDKLGLGRKEGAEVYMCDSDREDNLEEFNGIVHLKMNCPSSLTFLNTKDSLMDVVI